MHLLVHRFGDQEVNYKYERDNTSDRIKDEIFLYSSPNAFVEVKLSRSIIGLKKRVYQPTQHLCCPVNDCP
jgi:hypothetical protein